MSEPFIEPFEVCKCVPEFLADNGIGEKEGAAFVPVLQDESSHHFLLVQLKIFSHIQIIGRDPGCMTGKPYITRFSAYREPLEGKNQSWRRFTEPTGARLTNESSDYHPSLFRVSLLREIFFKRRTSAKLRSGILRYPFACFRVPAALDSSCAASAFLFVD